MIESEMYADVEEDGGPNEAAMGEHAVPWITYAMIGACAAIYAYINLAPETPVFFAVLEALVPSETAIWSGAYWGLVTSALVHVEFFHFLFNVMWARDFGSHLEPTMGMKRYFAFVLSSAAVSSGAQLALTDQTGIGLSGVVYAQFGYALAARRVEPSYKDIADKRTVRWLLGWLVLCIVLTQAGIWNIANAAHVAGFLFGWFAGSAFAARIYVTVSQLGLVLLVGLTVLAASYMPWSNVWQHRDEPLYGLLEQAAEGAEAGDPEAQLAYFHLLRESGAKKAESVAWLRASAGQGFAPAMNNLAWMLATESDERFRDGTEALMWAQRVCDEGGCEEASPIDTLAAAYAEVDDWDAAVATQTKAISKLTGEDPDERAGYEIRLQMYRNREKVRE